jgi:hypothetical protein
MFVIPFRFKFTFCDFLIYYMLTVTLAAISARLVTVVRPAKLGLLKPVSLLKFLTRLLAASFNLIEDYCL